MGRASPTTRPRRSHCAARSRAIMHARRYATSAEIAGEVGPFAGYDANREAMLRVIRNHRRAAYTPPASEYEGLTVTPVGIDPAHCEPGAAGRRARRTPTACSSSASSTASATPRSRCIAPTGTIGLVMDCDTTGIEPDFALVKFKKLAGGGYFKIINASVPPALARLGYTAQQIDDIVRYARRRRHARRLPAHQPGAACGQGLHRRAPSRASRRRCPARSTCRSRSTAGRSATRSCVERLGVEPDAARRARLRPADGARLHRRRDRRGQRYVCGTMTIEGAPHLKAEHLPVFDCANSAASWASASVAPSRTSA